MEPLPGVSQALDQQPFDEAVHVFVRAVDERRIRSPVLENRLQRRVDGHGLLTRQDAGLRQRPRPREAARDVVLEETTIETEGRAPLERGCIRGGVEAAGPESCHQRLAIGIIDRRRRGDGAAADDRVRAFEQFEPHHAGDPFLHRFDKAIERLAQRRKPQPAVDDIGVLAADGAAEALELARRRDLAGAPGGRRAAARPPAPRRFRAAWLPPTRCSTTSMRPTPCADAMVFRLAISSSSGIATPLTADGDAALERDLDVRRLVGTLARRPGQREDLFGRLARRACCTRSSVPRDSIPIDMGCRRRPAAGCRVRARRRPPRRASCPNRAPGR